MTRNCRSDAVVRTHLVTRFVSETLIERLATAVGFSRTNEIRKRPAISDTELRLGFLGAVFDVDLRGIVIDVRALAGIGW